MTVGPDRLRARGLGASRRDLAPARGHRRPRGRRAVQLLGRADGRRRGRRARADRVRPRPPATRLTGPELAGAGLRAPPRASLTRSAATDAPSCAAAHAGELASPRRQRRARPARGGPPAAARPARAAATAAAPRPRPSPPGRRSRPCRRRGGPPAPGSRRRARAPSSRGPRGRSRASTPASSSSTRPIRPAACSPGRDRPAQPSGRRFQVASTRIGLAAQPGQRGPQQPVRRILGGRRRHQHQRLAPRRAASTAPNGGSHIRGPTTCTPAGHAPWILELRERADHAQPLAQPSVESRHRRQPKPDPRVVQVRPAPTEPRFERALQRLPQRAGRAPCVGAGRPSAYGGNPGAPAGIQVRDQRRHRHALELARHRRREREDVVHDHIAARNVSDRTPE